MSGEAMADKSVDSNEPSIKTAPTLSSSTELLFPTPVRPPSPNNKLPDTFSSITTSLPPTKHETTTISTSLVESTTEKHDQTFLPSTKHPHRRMATTDYSISSDSTAYENESLPPPTMGSFHLAGRAGMMSYAAAAASAIKAETDTSQSTASKLAKGIKRFSSQDNLNTRGSCRDASSPNPKNRTPSSPLPTRKKSRERNSQKERSSKQQSKDFDLEEFTKLYPRTGYRVEENPILNFTDSVARFPPGQRRDDTSSHSSSLEEFKKLYPKTGYADEEELPKVERLREELLKHPKGSVEGQEKIDGFIQVCGAKIRNQLSELIHKRKTGIFGSGAQIHAEIRGLDEQLSLLKAIKHEWIAVDTDSSQNGSFCTAPETLSADPFDHNAKSTPYPIVRLPPASHFQFSSDNIDPYSGEFGNDDDKLADGTADSPDGYLGVGPLYNCLNRHKGRGSFTEDEDKNEMNANLEENNSTAKKALNFDSPAFTPASGVSNGTSRTNHPTLSSQAAAAAPFTPRGMGSVTPNPPAHQLETDPISTLNIANVREFTPSFDASAPQSISNGTPVPVDAQLQYDPFHMSSIAHTLPSTPYNPYMEDNNGLAADPMSSYYQTQSNYVPAAQPLQYHLYAPQGSHRDDLLPYQRQAHEFFIPERLRENFQRRAEATLQVMPNSSLPVVDPYHSLVALDTNIQHQNTQLFGYPSWIYKALSQKTGHYYCLRRLEGYRPTNDRAIRSVKDWRRVDGTHVVKIHDAFTTRAFGDSSLVIVTDYHPLSRTLSEHHLGSRNRAIANVHESTLWSYIVQISLALKEIHQSNLAARCIDPSKVILTDKNRIRLNACAILDVIQFEAARPLIELQQEDFQQFGTLILSIATHTPVISLPSQSSLDLLARDYSQDLVEVVKWLLAPAPSLSHLKNVSTLLQSISLHTAEVLTKLYSSTDIFTTEFFKELENSRISRLVIKLNFINERPEYAHNPDWAETGDRYVLKLMRDYIFHQVDEQGRPIVDLGWVVGCLNRLDTGSEERIELVSRDGNNSFLVSWRECKGVVAKTWAELMVGTGSGGSGGGGNGAGNGGGGSSSRKR